MGQAGIALGLLFTVKRVGMVLRNLNARSYGSPGEFTRLLYAAIPPPYRPDPPALPQGCISKYRGRREGQAGTEMLMSTATLRSSTNAACAVGQRGGISISCAYGGGLALLQHLCNSRRKRNPARTCLMPKEIQLGPGGSTCQVTLS